MVADGAEVLGTGFNNHVIPRKDGCSEESG